MPIDTSTAKANKTAKKTVKNAKTAKKDAMTVVDQTTAYATGFMTEVVETACEKADQRLATVKEDMSDRLADKLVHLVTGEVDKLDSFFEKTLTGTMAEAKMLPGDDPEIIDVSATSV